MRFRFLLFFFVFNIIAFSQIQTVYKGHSPSELFGYHQIKTKTQIPRFGHIEFATDSEAIHSFCESCAFSLFSPNQQVIISSRGKHSIPRMNRISVPFTEFVFKN